MTAINIILQSDRAVITTDSLFIDFRTGKPFMFMEKCFPVPGARMAVTARGDYRVPSGVAVDLPRFYANIDQVIADEGDAVRSLYGAWLDSMDEVWFAPVQIMVVGWSEELDRPRGALVALGDEWTFQEIDPQDGMAAPLPDDRELGRLARLGVDPGVDWDLTSYDPETHGIPFMEAQRRMKLPLPSNPKIETHIVGGHILLTEITRDCVTQRVIHEWADSLEQPVQPAPFKPTMKVVPAMPEGLSRQQRRAWERQHGKAAA